jgi:hypothetical protein
VHPVAGDLGAVIGTGGRRGRARVAQEVSRAQHQEDKGPERGPRPADGQGNQAWFALGHGL